MNTRLKSAIAIACLTLLLAIALTGCSDEIPSAPDPEPPTTAETAQDTPTPPAEPSATSEAAEEPEPQAQAQSDEPEREEQEEETDTAEPEPVEAQEEQEEQEAAQADTPAPAVWNPDDLLSFDPAVVRGTLSNGLVYYIRQNQEPRERAQLSLVVKAGSVLEEEQQRGLAHFVEHMAFNGTERFAKQEIVDYLESIGITFGADLNAGTSFDYTTYWLEIPTDDPEILETAFQILSDWAYAISFAPDEVDLERGVVLEEWRLGQGFTSRFWKNLFPLLFGDSIYAVRDPIGVPEVIEAASADDLRAFYERWYRPNLMAIVAVGDFEIDVIEAKTRQHFAPPPEGEAYQERAAVAEPTERPSYDVPDNAVPLVDVFTDPEAPVTQVTLVRKVAPENEGNLAAFRRVAVERLAFMMLNARLFERGQQADPPWLWSGSGRGAMVERLDIQTFTVVTEQDGVERGFGALLEEMQRVRQHGFTESELEREKANLLSEVEREYTQRDQIESGTLADDYRDHFLSGAPVPGVEAEWELYQQLLPLVSLAEVDEVGMSWAQAENTVLIVLGPEGIDPTGGDALAAALRTQIDGAEALVVEPYGDDFEDVPLLAAIPTPGSIVAEEPIDAIDAVRWTLSNGITVIAKQTDFRDDEIRFTAFSPGGHSLVADADYVSASYAADLVDGSGVGPHDSVALDKLLAGKRVSVSPYIGELFEGFNGNASPQDLETLFQLIALYATEPRLDPDYFTTYEARLRSSAELRPTQPDAVLYDRANTLLSQGHLRRRPLSVEVVDDLEFDRAQSVYADRFADLGDATFVFVGAFDWDVLRSLTSTYLASLPTSGRTEQWHDVEVDPPFGIIDEIVRSGIEPRSNSVWVFAGEADWNSNDVLALEVAGEMLGIRLRERVREALGGTYGIWVSTRARQLPRSRVSDRDHLRQRPGPCLGTAGRSRRRTRLAQSRRRAELPGHGQGTAPKHTRRAASGERLLGRADSERPPTGPIVRADHPVRATAGRPHPGTDRSPGPEPPAARSLCARRPLPGSGLGRVHLGDFLTQDSVIAALAAAISALPPLRLSLSPRSAGGDAPEGQRGVRPVRPIEPRSGQQARTLNRLQLRG